MLKPSDQIIPVNKEEQQMAGPPATKVEYLPTLMRLLVGGALIGVDEVLRRTKQWQAEVEPQAASKMVVAPFSELEENQKRHAFIGLLFEMPDVLWEGVVKAGQTSGKAGGLVGRVFG